MPRDPDPPNPYQPTQSNWLYELEDLTRGACGGFLFGIPLLYTMEVWWIGSYTRPPLMLLVLAVTFLVVFVLNRTDGFRQINPDSARRAFADSVEAIAIGIVCTTLTLIIIREITIQTSLEETLGKIIFESIPFSIGVALARSILASGDTSDEDEQSGRLSSLSEENAYNATLADIGATVVGSIIIAFSIAPTDEVPMIASAMSPLWLLAMLLMSLIVSYAIVFTSGLTQQQKRLQQTGLFQYPIEETIVSYLISLLTAALILWFFHRVDMATPWTVWLENSLVLGLPATVGGAAGRLAI